MGAFEQPHKVILVDHDTSLRGQLARYFATQGFKVSEADSATGMARALETAAFDLVIMEPEAPDLNGHALLNHLRSTDSTCCIVLTSNVLEIDRIIALELGADDYMIKPINQRELLARARAVLRRAAARERIPIAAISSPASNAGCIVFDRVQRRVTLPTSETLELTTSEFNLLDLLSDHVDDPLTRDKLYEGVFRRKWSPLDRTLDTLVAKLRRKLERDARHPELIKTVHGSGYVFTNDHFRKVVR